MSPGPVRDIVGFFADLSPLLVDGALRGTLLLAVVLLARRVIPERQAAVRHALLATGLIGLLALPALTLAAPWRLPVLPAAAGPIVARAASNAQVGGAAAGATGRSGPRCAVPSCIAARDDGDAQSAQAEGSAGVSRDDEFASGARTIETSHTTYLRAGAVAVWLVGLAGLSARLLLGLVLLGRRRRDAERLDDEVWTDRLERTKASLDLRAPVRLLPGTRGATALTWGSLRPVVLLPERTAEWSVSRCRVVLVHELVHVRRRDWLWILLAAIARDLHWFNPLAGMAWRRMRSDAEAACDREVLRAGVDRRAYARHLVEIARAGARRPSAALALGGVTDVERRVLRILEDPLDRWGGLVGTTVAGATTAAVLLAVAVPSADAVPPPPSDVGPGVEGVPGLASGPPPRPPAARAPAATPRPYHVVDALVGALSDPSPPVRRSALNALRDLGAVNDRREDVTPLLSDSVEDVRIAAAVALGLREPRPNMTLPRGRSDRREPDPLRVDHLTARLSHPDVTVRVAAANDLARLGALSATDDLIGGLEDPDFRMRQAAANALSNIFRVRRRGTDSSGDVSSGSAVAGLIGSLADPDVRVRRAAANALGNIGASRAAPSLGHAYDDPGPDVRQAVVSALGSIGGRSEVAVLVAALDDPDEHVRRVAAESLGEVGGRL